MSEGTAVVITATLVAVATWSAWAVIGGPEVVYLSVLVVAEVVALRAVVRRMRRGRDG